MTAFRHFKINWEKKALAFRAFDTLPFGRWLYGFTQRHITKTVPRPLSPTAETGRWFTAHAKAFQEHGKKQLDAASHFEFGAGWDLFPNLVLWCYGMKEQFVYDLNRWARPDQINIVIRHLMVDPPPNCSRKPQCLLRENSDFEEDLILNYKIRYHAPADAGETDLESGSIDTISTTSVLEHIPFSQIPRLLSECHRLMHPSSVMSHVIDYSDHYSHSDANITAYNFLRFTERQWNRFNPGIHYQNRGRHKDFIKLFEGSGFRVVCETHHYPENSENELRSLALASPFRNLPITEILPLTGHIVLQKN